MLLFQDAFRRLLTTWGKCYLCRVDDLLCGFHMEVQPGSIGSHGFAQVGPGRQRSG